MARPVPAQTGIEGVHDAVAVEVAVKRGEVRAFLAHVGEDDVDVSLGDGTVTGDIAGDRLPGVERGGGDDGKQEVARRLCL
jgi:hypothetical protein